MRLKKCGGLVNWIEIMFRGMTSSSSQNRGVKPCKEAWKLSRIQVESFILLGRA